MSGPATLSNDLGAGLFVVAGSAAVFPARCEAGQRGRQILKTTKN